MRFLAIDFETADFKKDSACALSLALVENDIISEKKFFLIRPPRRFFRFSGYHGITWDDVKESPSFQELWPDIKRYFEGIDYLAAHSAGHDKAVLKALCSASGITRPDIPFICSMKLAKEKLNIYPAGLNDVKKKLNIEEDGNPLQNAEACARIILKINETEGDKSISVNDNEEEEFPSDSINISVLGSSSYGNSTVIWLNGEAVMIDFGFSKKFLNEKLKEIGLDFSSFQGVFLTHLHHDHIKAPALNAFVKAGVPVYAHRNLQDSLLKIIRGSLKAYDAGLLRFYGDEAEIFAGAFRVKGFEVPHDSAGGCFGYNIVYGEGQQTKKVTVSTDIANAENGMAENFANSDAIVLEANHDLDMLYNSGRPMILINRIRETGHLSNDESAEFLADVMDISDKQPEAVILAHISQECNTNKLAEKTVRDILNGRGYGGIKIVQTHRVERSDTISLKLENRVSKTE